MEDIRNNLKKFDILKINLTRAMNYTYAKDTDEEYVMNLNSDNTKLVVYDKSYEVIKILFK